MPTTHHRAEVRSRACLRDLALVEHFLEVICTEERRLLFVEIGLSGPENGVSGINGTDQSEAKHVWAIFTDTFAAHTLSTKPADSRITINSIHCPDGVSHTHIE